MPVRADEVASTPGSAAGIRPRPGPDDPALILYTSGTTGPPKGVMLTAAAIAADLDLLAEAWAWTPEDVLVHGLPLFHVHGLDPRRARARCGSASRCHPHRAGPTPAAYAAAAAEGGTLFFGVPTVWSRVAAEAGRGRRSAPRPAAGVRQRRLAGSRVRAPAGRATGQGPVERYGMTETAASP